MYKRLKEIFEEIAAESGFEILALEIPGDHVHMFESAPQKWSLAEIVRRFKGRSSRLLMKSMSTWEKRIGGHAPRSGQKVTTLVQ